MASGYTRQSAASIVDGLTISAANHNNEYNTLETAFNGTTGHDHSGGSGLGPILLPPAVGMSSNGLYARTGASTVAARTITGSTGITVTDGDGVSGNPTLTLDAQLVDVAGLTPTNDGVVIGNGTNFVVESGATLKTSLGLTIGTNVQAWDADLDAVAALASTAGMLSRTGAGAFAVRTITGTAAEITVTNGSGASGAPTLSLPTALTFTGKTVTGGTFSSLTALSTAAATITGGSITGITDLAVADGGTGASTALAAVQNLGGGRIQLTDDVLSGVTEKTYLTAAWFDGTYDYLRIEITNLTCVTDNSAFALQYSFDGSTFAGGVAYGCHLDQLDSGATRATVIQGGVAQALLTNSMDSSGAGANIIIEMEDLLQTIAHHSHVRSYFQNASGLLTYTHGWARCATTDNVQGIRFFFSNDSVFSGRIRIWGQVAP